jgi:hypothetical protein
MTVTTAVDELSPLINELLHCVTSLEATHGDTPAMRRIVNDAQRIRNGIDRLGIDLAELGPAAAFAPSALEMIQISDTDYDVDFWRDVDHEGIGAQSLACVHAPQARS